MRKAGEYNPCENLFQKNLNIKPKGSFARRVGCEVKGFIFILCGVLFLFLGSLGIGIYIDTIIKSLNGVDKSLIFWHLIFLFVG